MMRSISYLLLVAATTIAGCGPLNADTKQESASKPFKVQDVASFNAPWAMTFLPDGRALVTEKAGRLLIWDGKGTGTVTVTGTPKVAYGGQGGLGDVVLHPKFSTNGLIYLSWVMAGDGGFGAAIGRGKLVEDASGARLEGFSVIWQAAPFVSGRGHFGHRMAFGRDDILYVSTGERQKFDPAQDLRSTLGKVLRLKEDGTPAPDNPFAADPNASKQIWSYGHRNPLGLAFAPDGRLWSIEMGPAHGDELNLVQPGKNYGYPKASNGNHYNGSDIPDHRAGDGFEPPKAFWNPAISPGSLMIYSGKLFPAWTGDAFIGALGGEALVRVDLDGENAGAIEKWAMGTRIREVEQGPDGSIWLLEDGDDGRLMKITPNK